MPQLCVIVDPVNYGLTAQRNVRILERELQLKDGTAYRQVRPTKLDKIKNLSHQVHLDAVIVLSAVLLEGLD